MNTTNDELAIALDPQADFENRDEDYYFDRCFDIQEAEDAAADRAYEESF